MKANMRTATGLTGNIGAGGSFNDHELRLTIGMIVKNEEKDLDKCLSSLKPLLEAVPSELIITDTGSTDSTVEIAQKYTDHIIHFEWCDDFSAARNTGLDAARGEWFLYLDADEWFDDVTELVDFFNSGECDRYGSASYIQRNYGDFSGHSYVDTHVCRIFRRFPNVRFRNKVHESVVIEYPLKTTNAFVHHYGYAFRNEAEYEKKLARNAVLLDNELEADPDDLKALLQYSQQISETSPEKAAEYAEHGLEVARQRAPQNKFHLQTRFAHQVIAAYYNCRRYDDVFSVTENALEREKRPCIFHLEFYRICQLAAWNQEKYEAAVKYGELYRKLYPAYHDGKMDLSLQVFEVFFHLSYEEYQQSIVMTGEANLKLGKKEEARSCLESLDLAMDDSMKSGSLPFCTDLAAQAKDWGIAVEFYRRIRALNDEEKSDAFVAYLNGYYASFPSEQEAILLAFADEEENSLWPLFCRLRLAESEGDRNKAIALLDALGKTDEQWDYNYADILWYVLKEKINMLPFLLHVDTDNLPPTTQAIQMAYENYSSVVGDYFTAFSFENPKALFCSVCLLERAVLSKNARENVGLYRGLLRSYLDNLAKFVRAVYRPEILTQGGLQALPRLYRFGFYSGLALDAKHVGDDAAYFANLRMGLKEYPVMKDCVDFLLKDFEEEKKKHDAQAEEFSALAKQVKQNIEQLIARGDLKQAGAYTLQLAKLIPEDDDMRRYRKLTHTEPTMAELASRLPQ